MLDFWPPFTDLVAAMIWTDAIELHEFERLGWLSPGWHLIFCRTDSDRRTVLLERRVELARLEAEAWGVRVVILALERCRISQQIAEMKVCVWAEDCDGGWETLCGGQFELTSGTPQSNGMAYCCYCGGSLVQIEYTDEAERDSNQQSQPVERGGS